MLRRKIIYALPRDPMDLDIPVRRALSIKTIKIITKRMFIGALYNRKPVVNCYPLNAALT